MLPQAKEVILSGLGLILFLDTFTGQHIRGGGSQPYEKLLGQVYMYRVNMPSQRSHYSTLLL